MSSSPPLSPRIWLTLSLFQILAVWSLAPVGREVEHQFKMILAGCGWQLLIAILITALAISPAIFRQLRGRIKLKFNFSLIAAALLTALAPLLVVNAVEYTHFILYGAIGLCLVGGLSSASLERLLLVMIMITLVSLIDEGLQSISPGRVFDLRDVGLNLYGGTIGWLMFRTLEISGVNIR